jgi:IclR family transcriptional regulator, KDG regulon repressor
MNKIIESLSSVEKALKIIRTLSDHPEGLGTLYLGEKLGLSTSTASRLLIILAKQDFVRKSPFGKKYILGNAILDIGRSSHMHLGSQLVPIAAPYIDSLRDITEESAVLEVLAKDNAFISYRANGPNVVSVSVKNGAMIPAHVSPGAKTILAFSPPDLVDSVLKIKLARYTSKTITDRETFKKEFEKIRKEGVAFANGEYNIELNAIGAPIFNKDKQPIAAVVLTMPKYRAKDHKQDELISRIKETAAKISEQVVKYKI